MDFPCVTVEDVHPGLTQDRAHLIGFAHLQIMVAEYGEDGNPHHHQLLGQDVRFLRQTIVWEISTEDKAIRAIGNLREPGLERVVIAR